jgi:hypothetical protein
MMVETLVRLQVRNRRAKVGVARTLCRSMPIVWAKQAWLAQANPTAVGFATRGGKINSMRRRLCVTGSSGSIENAPPLLRAALCAHVHAPARSFVKKFVLVSIGLSFFFCACPHKSGGNAGATTSASASSSAPSASVSGSAAPLASITVTGNYESTASSVANTNGAIKGGDAKDGVGPGTITMTFFAAGGQVAGTCSGALGDQILSGYLKDGRLTANVTPAASASARFWGTIDGEFKDNAVKGTFAQNSGDTRLVRAGTFECKAK